MERVVDVYGWRVSLAELDLIEWVHGCSRRIVISAVFHPNIAFAVPMSATGLLKSDSSIYPNGHVECSQATIPVYTNELLWTWWLRKSEITESSPVLKDACHYKTCPIPGSGWLEAKRLF